MKTIKVYLVFDNDDIIYAAGLTEEEALKKFNDYSTTSYSECYEKNGDDALDEEGNFIKFEDVDDLELRSSCFLRLCTVAAEDIIDICNQSEFEIC